MCICCPRTYSVYIIAGPAALYDEYLIISIALHVFRCVGINELLFSEQVAYRTLIAARADSRLLRKIHSQSLLYCDWLLAVSLWLVSDGCRAAGQRAAHVGAAQLAGRRVPL